MAQVAANKNRLITLLLAEHGTERRVWNNLSGAQKQALGTLASWSAKDHIVHVTYWREVYIQRLRAALSGGEIPPPDPDFLQTNDAVFEEHKNDSWETVLKWATRVQQELIEVIENFDDATLNDSERFEWTNERPLWQYIALGEGYHPYGHLCDILVLTNNFEEAEQVQLDLFDSLDALDDSDSWQGNQHYNLACFYALHGRSKRAVELLERSFDLNPDLLEWSKQDSDLDSLRELPAFLALYPEEVA